MQRSAISPEFFCDVQPDRDRVIVRVAGEMDLDGAPLVAAAVDELLDAGFPRIVVDLRGLSFLDSTGVHVLVAAGRAAAARGRILSLIRPPKPIHRVFELTQTESLLAFEGAEVRR
jgi:anti-sigma B factor antagonist